MSKNQRTSNLDLAARSIDLIRVIAKASPNYGSLAVDILQWLARERISNEASTFSLTLGQSFAAPNDKGLVLIRDLNDKVSHLCDDKISHLCGIQLILPGALGRTIMVDELHCWIATTEAVMLKYHNLVYTESALGDLLVYSKPSREDSRKQSNCGASQARYEKTGGQCYPSLCQCGARSSRFASKP